MRHVSQVRLGSRDKSQSGLFRKQSRDYCRRYSWSLTPQAVFRPGSNRWKHHSIHMHIRRRSLDTCILYYILRCKYHSLPVVWFLSTPGWEYHVISVLFPVDKMWCHTSCAFQTGTAFKSEVCIKQNIVIAQGSVVSCCFIFSECVGVINVEVNVTRYRTAKIIITMDWVAPRIPVFPTALHV